MFNRPPRIRTCLPLDTVKIPAPPQVAGGPGGTNWLTIGLPVAATVFSIILIVATSGASAATSFLIFIPVMLATYIASGIVYWHQRRDYRRALQLAQDGYSAELFKLQNRLDELKKQETTLRLANDPDFATCLTKARDQDISLGERRPADDDFLSVRVGVGTVRSSITIEAPAVNPRPAEFSSHLQWVDRLVAEYATIQEVPFLVSFERVGMLGLAGPRVDTVSLARAMVCQMAVHHWPTELTFAVIGKQDFLDDWGWTGKLPHFKVWAEIPIIAADSNDRNSNVLVKLEGELRRRSQLVSASSEITKSDVKRGLPLPRIVFIVDHYSLVSANPALKLMLEMGKDLGIRGIFLADERAAVPGECGAVMEFDYISHQIEYFETGTEGTKGKCKPDLISMAEASSLANALEAIEWPTQEDVSQPPKQVTFLDMFGVNALEELDIESWWDGNSRFGYLRAPIGKLSRDADLVFDLNDHDEAHGPHGLIGGMPGSGKSELLRTIVLSLALTHHPYDLNFALIDYKGGATFDDLAQLPHTVGVITDLETHASYAERVILSLSNEIRRRERILKEAKEIFGFEPAHIDEYRKLPVKKPLPRLVVIFDEFAQFKLAHPDESKALIEISRKGRSLGMHLILATQNLREAVDDVVRQNSNFLIALHVGEPSDSNQLIGIPDAAFLTKGRAYFRSRGLNLFQAAFSGAAYRGMLLPEDAIIRILPNQKREVAYPLNWNSQSVSDNSQRISEARTLLNLIRDTTLALGIPKPSPVWLDPLPNRVYLPELLSNKMRWNDAGWDSAEPGPAAVLGQYDDPANQNQGILEFNPQSDGGHLMVFGAPSSGKSTLLRTIVSSLAMRNAPNEVQVYIADMTGNPTLGFLEKFPHVGSVITVSEFERVQGLIWMLTDEAAQRSKMFRKSHVNDIVSYNQLQRSAITRVPAIVVIIDGLAELKQYYLEQIKDVVALLKAGRDLGIYFVITAVTQNDIPHDAFSNIRFKLTFYQTERGEYAGIVGQTPETRAAELSAEARSGLGLLRGAPPILFQAALPALGENTADQNQSLNETMARMREIWLAGGGEPVPPIEDLGVEVPLSKVLTLPSTLLEEISTSESRLFCKLGRDYRKRNSATTLLLGDDGHLYLVAASAPKMGKTTTLVTWALSMASQYPRNRIKLLIFDFPKHSLKALKKLPHISKYVGSRDQFPDGLREISAHIKQRRDWAQTENNSGESGSELIVLIDDYPIFLESFNDDEKKEFWDSFNHIEGLGLYLVFSANVADVVNDYRDPLVQRIRSQGSGVLLSPNEGREIYKNARIPTDQLPTDFPPGRGWLMRRGQPQLFQIAICDGAVENVETAIEAWISNLTENTKHTSTRSSK